MTKTGSLGVTRRALLCAVAAAPLLACAPEGAGVPASAFATIWPDATLRARLGAAAAALNPGDSRSFAAELDLSPEMLGRLDGDGLRQRLAQAITRADAPSLSLDGWVLPRVFVQALALAR